MDSARLDQIINYAFNEPMYNCKQNPLGWNLNEQELYIKIRIQVNEMQIKHTDEKTALIRTYRDQLLALA